MRPSHLAPLLLTAYAIAFGWRALGGGLLVVDDHPGQLYRLAHAVELGPWPWRLNSGWWAGYAELQYYPPGFAYVGAAVHLLALGHLGVEAVYGGLLWLVYLLPGVTTFWLLARVLGSTWLALPGAFIALTASAGSRSGVEEGLRWGLVAARLGWSLLPLLALALRSARPRRQPSVLAAVILAAIVITHPAHAPAGFVLVGLDAWRATGALRARLRHAAVTALAAVSLASFWLIPLLAHLEMARPLAWGDADLSALVRGMAGRPLLLVLAAGAALGCWRSWRASDRFADAQWLVAFAPAMAAVIALDALVAQPLGLLWLPADRVFDSFLLALILGASLALGDVWRRQRRMPDWAFGLGAVALAVLLASPGRSEPTLTLWPTRLATEWTKAPSLVAGARLDALWAALRQAPSGRILFVRSSVPLAYRPEWWRPHSHVTGLAPLRAGRDILNGTFTHPSPIAALVYTGSAARQAITQLVEERDGLTLFGRPLDELAPEPFNRLAQRLRVSGVVALEEDTGRLEFMRDNPSFAGPARITPFLVWTSVDARALPTRSAPQRWQVPVTPADGGWATTGLAYSPLWRAQSADRGLEIRADELGLLEIKAPSSGPAAIELTHPPGRAEWLGMAVSGGALLAMAGLAWRRRATR